MSNLTKRQGEITLTRGVLDSMPIGALKALFGNFYPIFSGPSDIHTLFLEKEEITYLGYSEHFEEQLHKFVEPIPKYDFFLKEENGKWIVEFKKINIK